MIVVSGICTGSVYPLIKIAQQDEIPRFSYIFWESVIIVCLVAVFAYLREEKALFKKEEWKYYSFCAVTNILIPQTLSFMIAPHMPASVNSVVVILTPIFVYSCLLLFFHEKLIWHKAAGIILGLVGAASLFLPAIFQDSHNYEWYWLLISLMLPSVYALNRLYASRLLPNDTSPFRLTIGLFSIVALISGPLIVMTGQSMIPNSLSSGELALFAHSFLMAIFYVLFFIIAKKGAVQNSLAFYVGPLTGVGWGIIFFEEKLTIIFCISSAILFYALYLVNKQNIKTDIRLTDELSS